MPKDRRTDEFARNLLLEELLESLNGFISRDRTGIPITQETLRRPLLFIVGCPRSGTTLLLQWLAASGEFSYPSNLISRFYGAPVVGAMVQKMLVERRYKYRNEMDGIVLPVSGFESDLGKTEGLLAPNEFYYFWRRFFNFDDLHKTDNQFSNEAEIDSLRLEVAQLMEVLEKPFVCKGMHFNWHLPLIASIFPNALFLEVRRNPLYNMQSLLKARRRFFGNDRHWYSFRPPEYEELKTLAPSGQVAGQVYYTRQAIKLNSEQIDGKRWLAIDYDAFCENPQSIWKQIRERLILHGVEIAEQCPLALSFRSRDQVETSEAEAWDLAVAYQRFNKSAIRERGTK